MCTRHTQTGAHTQWVVGIPVYTDYRHTIQVYVPFLWYVLQIFVFTFHIHKQMQCIFCFWRVNASSPLTFELLYVLFMHYTTAPELKVHRWKHVANQTTTITSSLQTSSKAFLYYLYIQYVQMEFMFLLSFPLQVYAPMTRTGVFLDAGSERYTVQSTLTTTLEGLLELEASLPSFITQPR